MRKLPILIASICLLVTDLASAADDDLTLVISGKEKVFRLKDLKAKLKTVTVSLDDPVYGEKKTFDGFRLNEVLALGGLDPKAANDEIVFTAKDGYSPNTSFEKMRAHSAVVTYQESGGKPGAFGKVRQGKAMISPAPYYVVWEEGKSLIKEVPWAYQLVRIEVVDFAVKYSKLYPKDAKAGSGVMLGFATFKNECIRCHSVNLQGGDLGPELNAPKNVVEYWDRPTLKEFIRNPLAFRYKDKMPGFPQLADADIDHVLEYFDHMKTRKIPAP